MTSGARARVLQFQQGIGRVGRVGRAALLLACVGCGTTDGTTPTRLPDPGTPTEQVEPESLALERQRVLSLLDEVAGVDAAGLEQRYPASFADAPTYDAESLQGLSLIQASTLALNDAELSALTSKGFVVSDRQSFPSFAYGYQNIYADDLPVYISADSILDAIHRSYEDILKSLELELLSTELSDLLAGMRARLGSGVGAELGEDAVRDTDVFLTVAASLATGQLQQAGAGGDQALIEKLVKAAEAHEGWQQPTLFGVMRDEDFSQYEPRGHYADEPALQRYFRAMMWLGRIDFRLLETQSDGTQVFRRRQLEGTLLLNELVDAQLKPHFESIDSTLQAFVGEPDYMVLGQVPALLEALGVTSAAAVAQVPDETIVAAILSGGFGTQRISSHIMINGLHGAGTLPLSASFALMGQRYVVDSHVFSNVVFDRVAGGKVKRMMPSPLDVGFAALGNNQAAQLLAPELESYAYAPDLGAMRVLVDDHPREFWQKNLYNLWLDSLRALAPAAEVNVELPAVAQSEPWSRRLLGAQLASWAQLRHDTILYAKQSYTGGVSCEFPDAYVDPYPELYARIQAYGELGESLLHSLSIPTNPALKNLLQAHFQKVASVARTLREIAQYQLSGTELTAEMMSFINQAVVLDQGCGDPSIRAGWYAQLFFNTETAPDYDPTIADVHTQPTDEVGAPVGRVLHVATGMPRLMVVAIDTCTGPRAYAGLSSSYFEKTTERFERLNDEEWANSLRAANPDDVSWLSDVVTRSAGPRPVIPESE
jgi:hypothetical protein